VHAGYPTALEYFTPRRKGKTQSRSAGLRLCVFTLRPCVKNSVWLVTVKKLTFHLPGAQMESSLCAAAQTLSISAPPARERSAELPVPTTKHPCYQIADFSRQRLHDIYLLKSPKIRFIH